MYWFHHKKQTIEVGACCVHDRVTKTSPWGAEGPEIIEDAAGWGGHTDDIPDAGQTYWQRHSPGGAHTWEEGPVPQACRVPGHQQGKESHKSYYTLNNCVWIKVSLFCEINIIISLITTFTTEFFTVNAVFAHFVIVFFVFSFLAL